LGTGLDGTNLFPLTSVGVPSALVVFMVDKFINAYLEQNPKQ
jgi:hypothetical protein